MGAIRKKLIYITIGYWFLLLYMVAALVWWFVALDKQNTDIANIKLAELDKNDTEYIAKANKIYEGKQRKTTQYLGEGITFFALIVVGAVLVYNATRKQIKLSTQQQNFMMAVTHELKTPIAITQLNLETLQKHKLEEVKQQKLITNTLKEANRLNSLCNNILLAAQLDGGVYNSSKLQINFSDLVKGCFTTYNNHYPNGKIVTQIEENIFVLGEVLLLQMLVNNLIDNAIKYSSKEETILITVNTIQNEVVLKVIDNGVGISNIEKNKVFEKFYRSGSEETRTTKGTGLGLYLCKKIVDQHNAKILVTDNKPKGSVFTITFKA